MRSGSDRNHAAWPPVEQVMTQRGPERLIVMPSGVFDALAVRQGHFRLESGYHTDLWLELDTLFVDPVKIAPAVTMLAGRLRRYACDAVCGPMVGGAFLAQALAAALRVCFFY